MSSGHRPIGSLITLAFGRAVGEAHRLCCRGNMRSGACCAGDTSGPFAYPFEDVSATTPVLPPRAIMTSARRFDVLSPLQSSRACRVLLLTSSLRQQCLQALAHRSPAPNRWSDACRRRSVAAKHVRMARIGRRRHAISQRSRKHDAAVSRRIQNEKVRSSNDLADPSASEWIWALGADTVSSVALSDGCKRSRKPHFALLSPR